MQNEVNFVPNAQQVQAQTAQLRIFEKTNLILTQGNEIRGRRNEKGIVMLI